MSDLFGYLSSIIQVFFSMPGSLFDQPTVSTDDLLSNPYSSAASAPLLPLRGIHRCLRTNLLTVCSMCVDAVELFSDYCMSKDYQVYLDDPSFDIFSRRKKRRNAEESNKETDRRSGTLPTEGNSAKPRGAHIYPAHYG